MGDPYQMVLMYIMACCCTLSTEDFQLILSPSVELKHQTNQEEPVNAKGDKTVISLFEKYIFNNTSQIDIRSINIHRMEDRLVLNLVVKEDKREGDATNRYLFEETTTFTFAESDGKVSSIDTVVKRSLPIAK